MSTTCTGCGHPIPEDTVPVPTTQSEAPTIAKGGDWVEFNVTNAITKEQTHFVFCPKHFTSDNDRPR